MIDTLTQNALSLTETEQDSLFRMLTDYADILTKIIPNAPLLDYIVTGIPQSDDPIIRAYVAWKIKNQ
jgi:hypothetical protein